MKVIISHDIDHYYWSDHLLKDLFIPKYILKNAFYLLKGQIPWSWFRLRMHALTSNRLHRLEELTNFNKQQGIPASYFMGVRNALNLSYSRRAAKNIAKYLKAEECPLYLHGIAFDDIKKMDEERNDFLGIMGQSGFLGVRMHYLRIADTTLECLASLGYNFDSTTYDLRNPYFIGKMIEFPISVMDAYEMDYMDTDLENSKKKTLEKIQRAQDESINYFTVIFHDVHFSDSFPLQKAWYIWLVNHLKSKQCEFIDFQTAIKEISK